MKNHFSKSKYCRLWQCPKMLWMDKYKPEEKAEDAADDSRMEAGTEVGKLARELFGKSVDVTETVNGRLDLPAMIDRTQVEIEHGTSVICEASFSYQGCYCAVDILKRENDGWAIYEVKSSTVNEKNMKAVYVADVAYQKYVLEYCGVKRKLGLLHKLRATTDLKQRDMEYMKLCCECMNQAVRYLTMESRTIFLIQLMGYDDDNKSDIMDGPYIMTSLEDMKKAVQEYYWNDFDSTWETLYWRVELYLDGKNEIKKNEFLSPMYTYIMDKAGEIQYFIHEKLSLNYLKGPLGSMVERQFYSVCPDLNLPVPYQPGDVLFIDCRPYAPGAFYCLLKEVGDDCCGIQCEYVNPKGEVETGALKHGDYFFNHREVYQYLSPLYKARIVSKDELDWNDYIKGKRKC